MAKSSAALEVESANAARSERTPEPERVAHRSLLTELRPALGSAVDAELSGTGFSGRDCPWIDWYLQRAHALSPEAFTRAVRLFTKQNVMLSDPAQLREALLERVRVGVREWRASGRSPTAPVDDLPSLRGLGALIPSPSLTALGAGAGNPLPGSLLGPLESFFGADLAGVRVHDDAQAAAATSGAGALALARGQDIALSPQVASAGAPARSAVLAHEVAHTLEQRGAAFDAGGTHDERGATDAGRAWAGGQRAPPLHRASSLSLASCKPAERRKATAEELARLRDYDVYLSHLAAAREDLLEGLRSQDERAWLGEDVAADPAAKAVAAKQRAENVAQGKDALAQLDAFTQAVSEQRSGLEQALADVYEGEQVVWFDSQLGIYSGWLPERYARMQGEQEADPSFRAGFKAAMQYTTLRERGESAAKAAFKVGVVSVGQVVGVTPLYEAISGKEAILGTELSTEERLMRAVVGTLSIASLVAAGGPRVAGWAKGLKGSVKIARLAPAGGPPGAFGFVFVLADGAIPLALTQAEIASLVTAGALNLQMAAAVPGGGGGAKVPGLTSGTYGPVRGGGGSPADKAYVKKVTGRDDSVYVEGTEFDGFDKTNQQLLDAKRASGKGSWYDATRTDGFFNDVAKKDILAQARRQLAVLPKSGAKGITWHVADADVARSLRALFRSENIGINVVHTPP
ncbi:MAG: eCIS core domain-containing protein [Myxococcota bacterium]